MKDKIFIPGINTVMYTDSSKDDIDKFTKEWLEKPGTNIISTKDINNLNGLLTESRREKKITINVCKSPRLPIGVSACMDAKIMLILEASNIVVMYDKENNDFLILKNRSNHDMENTKVTIDQLV